MKTTYVRKMSMILVFLLCFSITSFVTNDADAEADSNLARYLTRYDYVLSQSIAEQIQVNFVPQEADCGPVQVRFDEILYDGQWVYTSASVKPTNHDKVIVMPGDVQKNDPITGYYDEVSQSNARSFETAAKDDNKQLLCVYAYLKEFDSVNEYFLDHTQKDDNVSVLISGARLAGGSVAMEIAWSIKVYDVDLRTGEYSLINEYLFPATIQPLQPYVEQEYYPCDNSASLFASVTLTYTPLNTHAVPEWKDPKNEAGFFVTLVDDAGKPMAGGVPLATYAYMLEKLPKQIELVISERETGEIADSITLIADGITEIDRQE